MSNLEAGLAAKADSEKAVSDAAATYNIGGTIEELEANMQRGEAAGSPEEDEPSPAANQPTTTHTVQGTAGSGAQSNLAQIKNAQFAAKYNLQSGDVKEAGLNASEMLAKTQNAETNREALDAPKPGTPEFEALPMHVKLAIYEADYARREQEEAGEDGGSGESAPAGTEREAGRFQRAGEAIGVKLERAGEAMDNALKRASDALENASEKAKEYAEWALKKYEKIPWYGKIILGGALAVTAASAGPASGAAWVGLWGMSLAGGVIAGRATYHKRFEVLRKKEGFDDEKAHKHAQRWAVGVGGLVGSMRAWLPVAAEGSFELFSSGNEFAHASTNPEWSGVSESVAGSAEALAAKADSITEGLRQLTEESTNEITTPYINEINELLRQAETANSTEAERLYADAQKHLTDAYHAQSLGENMLKFGEQAIANGVSEDQVGALQEQIFNALKGGDIDKAQDLLEQLKNLPVGADGINDADVAAEIQKFGAEIGNDNELMRLSSFEGINSMSELQSVADQMFAEAHKAGLHPESPHMQNLLYEFNTAVESGDEGLEEAKSILNNLGHEINGLREFIDDHGPTDVAPGVETANEYAYPTPPETGTEYASELSETWSHTVEKGDHWDKFGVWGGMQVSFDSGILGDALAKAGIESLPRNLEESFIQAIHQTLHESSGIGNENFIKLLGDNISIEQTVNGFRTVVPEGSVVNPAKLLVDSEFLHRLELTLEDGPYTSLREALGPDNLDNLMNQIQNAAKQPA